MSKRSDEKQEKKIKRFTCSKCGVSSNKKGDICRPAK